MSDTERWTADRRGFLRVVGGAGAGVVLSGSLHAAGVAAASGAQRRAGRRAYVVVIDGCRPDELDSGLMPTVQRLRNRGTYYPRARSLPVMETIPNHVMMMTGVRPDRSGVPANSIYDRAAQTVRDLDRARDLHFPTVIERLNDAGHTTATVLSKTYLYGIFGKRATYRWEPAPVVPVSGHAPDVATMDAAIAMVDEHDPSFMFVNLGDVDRFAHADLTGPLGLRAQRRAALADVDQQVGRFVGHLREKGLWQRSMLVVLADHSMDWSVPTNVVSLSGPLGEDRLLAGHVQIAQNGGAELLYWTGAPDRRAEARRRMRRIAHEQEGVFSVRDRRELRLGPRAGDLVVYCDAGWRFSDPDEASNPIPGNHGHPVTRPIPFFVSGGHPRVRHGVTSALRAHTQDVAPTVGEFFGLGAPRGGYDGTSRL